MRYGIISDIHSNLEAFDAVLEALSKEHIDRYVCPGDVVGYGANPKECIKIVKGLNPIAVCGNHDAGCTGSTGIAYFNETAKEAVLWTKDKLDEKELDYLNKLDFVHEGSDFILVHGTLQQPKEFLYMLNYQAAYGTFELMRDEICIIGHSHMPGIFIYDNDKVEYAYEERTKLSEGKKYILNAGSVGQPRDEDNRACYCIYDSEKKVIQIKRISYDIEKAQSKILKAGLPEMLATRLSAGR